MIVVPSGSCTAMVAHHFAELFQKEPETLALVNYDLCLERVSWLLLLEKPSAAQVQEALHLLELVAGQTARTWLPW